MLIPTPVARRFTAALIVLAGVAPRMTVASTRSADYLQPGISIAATQTLNIALPDGSYVSGTVLDSSRQPLTGASVLAIGPNDFFDGWAVTDSTGEFRLALRAGTYDLLCSPPSVRVINPSTLSRLVAASVPGVNVSADTSVPAVTLQNGYLLKGNLVPPSGKMSYATGTLLAAKRPSGSYVGGSTLGEGVYQTQYSIALPAGKHTLLFAGGQAFDSNWKMLQASSFATLSVNITKDTTKNIVLAKGYSLTGTAADSAGKPLHGIIYARPAGVNAARDPRATAISVVSGKFITNLPAGTYDWIFIPSMPSTYSGKATKTAGALTMPAAAKTLSIAANDGVLISGKVKDAAGAAVYGAAVGLQLADADPISLDAIPLVAVTARNGSYRIAVPAGTYDLHAWPGL